MHDLMNIFSISKFFQYIYICYSSPWIESSLFAIFWVTKLLSLICLLCQSTVIFVCKSNMNMMVSKLTVEEVCLNHRASQNLGVYLSVDLRVAVDFVASLQRMLYLFWLGLTASVKDVQNFRIICNSSARYMAHLFEISKNEIGGGGLVH